MHNFAFFPHTLLLGATKIRGLDCAGRFHSCTIYAHANLLHIAGPVGCEFYGASILQRCAFYGAGTHNASMRHDVVLHGGSVAVGRGCCVLDQVVARTSSPFLRFRRP